MLCGLAVTHIVAHISTVTLLWEGQKRKGKLLSAVHVQSIEMIKAFYTLWQTWSTERLLFLPPSHAVNNSRWVFVHKYPPISIESSVQLSELEQCRRCPRFDPTTRDSNPTLWHWATALLKRLESRGGQVMHGPLISWAWRRCGGPRFDQSRIRTNLGPRRYRSQIRTEPGFAFVTNVVSVSNTSSIEIILLSRTS